MNRSKLNERQFALLRRITDGAEPVTSDEPSLAVTVYALRNRGLVEARRRHGHWTAEVTSAGRFLLDHGRHPGDGPKQASVRSMVRPDRALVMEPSDLVRKLQANAGVLRVSVADAGDRAAWRRTVHAAARLELPDGLRLTYAGRDSGDFSVRLAS